MARINRTILQSRVDDLNKLVGAPTDLHYKSEKTQECPSGYRQNPGVYHLDCAFDGYRLDLSSENGGSGIALYTGYTTPGKLYDAIGHYMAGIRKATVKGE